MRRDVPDARASLRVVAVLLAAMSLLNVSSLCMAMWSPAAFSVVSASSRRCAGASARSEAPVAVCHCLKCMMPGVRGRDGKMACCCTGKSADTRSASPCYRGVCDTEETARLNASWTPPAVLVMPFALRPNAAVPCVPLFARRADVFCERCVAPPAQPPRFVSRVKNNHHCLAS